MTPDELVEKVALAICEDAGMAQQCRIPCAICKVDARAAIAVALEEAARVADAERVELDVDSDSYLVGRVFCVEEIAAAIRALVKEPQA